MTTATGQLSVALSDGSTVRVRRVVPEDEAGLRALLEALPPEQRWLRFFSGGANLGAAAARAAAIDAAGGCGLVAIAGADARIVGHAELVPERPGVAEVAFEVAPDWQQHGIATLLLGHLAQAAGPARDRDLHGARAAREPPDGARVPRVRVPRGRRLPRGRARADDAGIAHVRGARALRAPRRRRGGRRGGARPAARLDRADRRLRASRLDRRRGAAQPPRRRLHRSAARGPPAPPDGGGRRDGARRRLDTRRRGAGGGRGPRGIGPCRRACLRGGRRPCARRAVRRLRRERGRRARAPGRAAVGLP